MKAMFLGHRGPCGQVERIQTGWIENGGETSEDPEKLDLIYCNDGGFYEEGLRLKNISKKAKLIFNVLDIPKKYYPNLDLNNLKQQLVKADILTTISAFSKKQIQYYLGLEANIIFNPIKNVQNLNMKRDIDFLYVGRLYEPNKRFSLALEALNILKVKNNQFVIAGPDSPGNGLRYVGCVNDQELNLLYNRSKILICPTEYGVLGLPPIEGAVCGCIPILCSDNEAAKEFGLELFSFSPNPREIADGIKNINVEDARKRLIDIGEDLYKKLNKNKIAENIKELIC